MRKHIWVVPAKKDERFSKKMMNRFGLLAKSLGITAFSIEIQEKYLDEGEPHYHILVSNGLTIDLPGEIGVNASYSATAKKKTYSGQMKMRVRSEGPTRFGRVLAAALFAYYDEYVRKYYPEWKTDYVDIEFFG